MKNTPDFILSKNIRHFVQYSTCVDSHVVTHQSPHLWGRFKIAPIFGIFCLARNCLQWSLECFCGLRRFRRDYGIKRSAELFERKFISDVRSFHKERALKSEWTSTTKRFNTFYFVSFDNKRSVFPFFSSFVYFTFYRFLIPQYTPQTAVDVFSPIPAFVSISHHSISPKRLSITSKQHAKRSFSFDCAENESIRVHGNSMLSFSSVSSSRKIENAG